MEMSKQRTRSMHRRILLASVLFILLGAMLAPLSGYLYVGITDAQAQMASQTAPDSANWDETNPRSEYWREVREGTSGYSTDTQAGADTLIVASGQDWRRVRNGVVSTYGAWFLALVVLGLGLFYLIMGPIKLREEPSGRTVTRWSKEERILHWSVAVLFIIMALTGLS